MCVCEIMRDRVKMERLNYCVTYIYICVTEHNEIKEISESIKQSSTSSVCTQSVAFALNTKCTAHSLENCTPKAETSGMYPVPDNTLFMAFFITTRASECSSVRLIQILIVMEMF